VDPAAGPQESKTFKFGENPESGNSEIDGGGNSFGGLLMAQGLLYLRGS
jgi:hypothetical protein